MKVVLGILIALEVLVMGSLVLIVAHNGPIPLVSAFLLVVIFLELLRGNLSRR